MATPGAELLAYHERTKHSVASVYGGGHHLDWANMPRPFKVYPALDPIPLPRDFTTSTRPAIAALEDAGTTAGPGAVDRATLAQLLYFSAGIVRRRTHPGGEIYFRAAACTGALYHIDLYLVCGPLPDLDAGVYHFGPHDFALRRLRDGDHRATVVAASGGEPALAAAPAILAFTTTFWRNAWKYQTRAYRHAFWDSGTLLANLLAVAAAVALPARIVLGFVDDVLNGLLALDSAREATIGLVALGRSDVAPAPSPAIESLALETLPASAHEVDYPAIGAAHAASSLADPAEAAAWRATSVESSPAPPEGPRIPLAASLAVPEPIEAVILRRGSTRVFAQDPVPFEALSTVLRAATRGIPGDWHIPRPEPYVIVHAVDGLEPGAYVVDRATDTLVRLHAGGVRREAGHLALGQDLAADAAFNVFWLVDLAPILSELGNRGYRAAQLEAAIEGGKAYLAAYAVGLGATGLTFFDDEVTRFFSPHAAGKSVMFLVACGRPGRR
ncbi:MAG TPA: SagB family peptide dehydrogenase [Candidatus Binatia bacterium]|nr:SagB family peptide dehydrogenase [Candidatus Binatia bacterium]